MAEVTGPIPTLPGSRHVVPEGTKCDVHPGVDAVARVQGETDSFGSEMYDMCSECLKSYLEEAKTKDTSGKCDWCKDEVEVRVTARDYDEGTGGRVYEVCKPCRDKQDKAAREEMEEYYSSRDCYDYED